MELGDAVRRRRMVRTYDPDRPVPREVVTRLLDHATRAPSAGFSQGWHFLVLREDVDRARFWAATTGVGDDGEDGEDGRGGDGDGPDAWLRGLMTAPLLVLCLSDKEAYLDRYAAPDKGWADRDERRWPVPYWDVDTGMAALLMLLTAVDEGLASCFFGVPAERVDGVRAAFAVPSRLRPVGVVSVGYPSPTGPDRRSPSLRRGRRPLVEVVSEGAFDTPWEG